MSGGVNIICMILVALVAVDVDQAITTRPAASKLWLTDFAAFASANPRGQFIVAQSSKPAITAQEAEASARQCAVDALVPQVQSRMNGQIDIKLLRRHVEASLLSDNWIVDRQVEATERPYGTIWRESILIDVSSRKLDELGKRVQFVARREQGRRLAAAMGSSALLIIVSLGYLVLNWLTRGYLRFRLAMTSLLIAAGGIALITHLAHLV